MPGAGRYKDPNAPIPFRALPAYALRDAFREGYGRQHLRSDILAGTVVAIVALPLSMALAIAVGAPPQHGLYTAIVAGFVVALLGGSRLQVTGPTAAFVVILAPIVANHGIGGLLVAGLMGGILLVLMGLLRLGRLIEFIPHPVTTGFTAGIAVVIATFQLKDLFGLAMPHPPDHYFERIAAMWNARGTASLWEFGVGGTTLALLLIVRRITQRIPAPLIVLPLAAIACWILTKTVDGFQVATIASRFHDTNGIPQSPPLPVLPWAMAGAGGRPFELTFDTIRSLMPAAFAIAMLGAIESLLSAVVADAMARTKHDPDAELLALGVGNILCPFFGGIPATGALARTATNFRSGGRSPIACMVQAVTVLLIMLLLAPLIGYLPMTSLAALLVLVAWNMSEYKHFVHALKVAPKSDSGVMVLCFVLTVAFDMVVAVTVGVILAAMLFMKRMANLTSTKLLSGTHPELPKPLPEGIVLYDIDGPLFFGAAQRAMGALDIVSNKTRVAILTMEDIPMMDATGLVALESAIEKLGRMRCVAILSGLQSQPAQLIQDAEFTKTYRHLSLAPNLEAAVAAAEEVLKRSSTRTFGSPTGTAAAPSPTPGHP